MLFTAMRFGLFLVLTVFSALYREEKAGLTIWFTCIRLFMLIALLSVFFSFLFILVSWVSSGLLIVELLDFSFQMQSGSHMSPKKKTMRAIMCVSAADNGIETKRNEIYTQLQKKRENFKIEIFS